MARRREETEGPLSECACARGFSLGSRMVESRGGGGRTEEEEEEQQ